MDFKYSIISYNSGKFEVFINDRIIMEKNIDIYDAENNKLIFGEIGQKIKLEQIKNFINQIKDGSGTGLLVLDNSNGSSIIHYKNSSIVFETCYYGNYLTFTLPVDSSEQKDNVIEEFNKFFTQCDDYIKN